MTEKAGESGGGGVRAHENISGVSAGEISWLKAAKRQRNGEERRKMKKTSDKTVGNINENESTGDGQAKYGENNAK